MVCYFSGTFGFVGSILSENFSITAKYSNNSHVNLTYFSVETSPHASQKKSKEDKKESFGSLLLVRNAESERFHLGIISIKMSKIREVEMEFRDMKVIDQFKKESPCFRFGQVWVNLQLVWTS